MQELKKEKLSLEIQNNYLYNLDIPADGTCLIEIIANAKSWWQNTKSFKSFFQDDDLAVKIDGIEFPKLSGKRGLFDGEAAWNGNNLKGLSKTNLFLVKLDKGSHAFNFLADQTPILESIAIYATDEAELNYIPTENNPAQDDNRRQWITIILVNIAIKNLTIKATAKKYPNNADDDDLKLILDGKIEPNTEDKSHKNWFWCGRTLQGQEKEFNRELSWQAGLHYVELWADRTPELKSFNIELMSGDTNQQNKWTQLKQYIFKGSNGKENYNRYDKQIIEVVDFWNKEFFSQEFPPNEPLDTNLVKAMIFQESRVGYFTGAEINIMQVGNLGDPSLDVLSGKTKNPEYETINGQL